MEWSYLLILFVVFLVVFAAISKGPATNTNYRKKDVLFSAAERSFLGVLELAVSDKYRVLGKVRVADILTPAKGMDRKNWQIAFNKISAKHFDYVLCCKESFRVIAVVELDDKSHDKPKSKARDKFLESACKSADLYLVRFPAKAFYVVNDVTDCIENVINPAVHENV